MRYRLVALHHQLGGGVLRSLNEPGKKCRKWWFNPVALQAGLALEPNPVDVAMGEHALRIEDVEKKTAALRNAHRDLKKRVKRIEEASKNEATIGNCQQSSATDCPSLKGDGER